MFYKRFEIEQITRKGNFVYRGTWVNGLEIIGNSIEDLKAKINEFLDNVDNEFPKGEFLYK